MKELFRQVIQLFILMVILIIPFLLFHEQFAAWWTQWQASPPSLPISFLVVTSLLAGDILLPVPSSLVCTFAGVQMGWLAGTLACWLGMNLGCIIAFALARRFGGPFVQRFSKDLLAATLPSDIDGNAVDVYSDGIVPLILQVLQNSPATTS